MIAYKCVLLVCTVVVLAFAAEKPNIIFIAVDDLGWNDVGWVNPDIISPNIDALAKSGVILDQYYVQPLCSPSRAAWMTGFYPYRLGLQHLVIIPYQPVCVPTDKTFMPQVLQKAGYSTHAMGKWHLGFCKWECTPTYRGFDTFQGFYNGAEDHNTKVIQGGYDYRNNKDVDKGAASNYSSYLMADHMERVISGHNTSAGPLFVYTAFQNVHRPLQVPARYEAMYPHIKDDNRRLLSAMVTAMDEAVGRMVKALEQKGIMNNTLIVFTSDNGGWTDWGGNNFPLRGGKVSIFEGGTRVAGFVHGPMLNQTGGRFTGLMHAVDWFPTLVDAAGISYSDAQQDGISQWAAINNKTPGKREEFIYNLDFSENAVQGRAAIRMGDYKLIDGYPGKYQDWVKPNDTEEADNPFRTEDVSSATNYATYEDLESDMPRNLTAYKYLFNLKDDPTEHNNLYFKLPEIAKKLEARLTEVAANTYVAPNFPAGDPKSDPNKYGGVWTPGWC